MFIRSKKVITIVLTIVMVVSTVLVGKFTVTKAANSDDKAFSMSNFRLNNSTQNKVEYGSSTPISLGIQITNEDKGYASASDFAGKFYFYYYRKGQDKVNDSILLNSEGFSAALCTDELKAQYGITDESGIKNDRLVAFCKTEIDTTAYELNDVLCFWIKYVPGTDDYYSNETVINENIGTDKEIRLVAPTTVQLKLDNIDDIEYGNTITLNAEVTSPYTGNQIDPLSGTVTFVITGANGTTYTYVRTTSKDTDGKCQLEVPDELAADGYTVTATYDPTSDSVMASTVSTTFNVTKKPITIYPYPIAQEIQKDDAIPEYFDGYAAKDRDGNVVSVQLKNVKFVTEITDTSVVGTTGRLYVSDAQKAVIEADNPNYSISYAEGTLKVVTTRVNEAPVIELIPPVSVPSKEVKVNFRVSDEYTPNNKLAVTVKDANNNIIKFEMDASGNCSFVAKENTSYTITVSDEDTEVGAKESTEVVVIDNIDTIAPVSEIKKNTEEPTKDGVIVTLTPNDEADAGAKEDTSGIVSIRVTDESGNKVSVTDNTFTAAENGAYNVVITDKAGNTFIETVTVDNIDKVPPTLTTSKNTEEPAKEVTVTLTPDDKASEGAKDGVSGIDSIKVTDSEGNEIPVNDNKFTVDENGEYIVIIKDKSGNEIEEKIIIDNIIKEVPTEPETPKETEPSEPETPTVSTEPEPEAPSTGDITPITLYVVMLLGALFALGAGVITYNKKKEEQ